MGLTTRTILHTKMIPDDYFTLFDKIVSLLCFLLVLADFHILFATAIDYQNDWSNEMSQKMAKKHERQRNRLLNHLETHTLMSGGKNSNKKNKTKGNKSLNKSDLDDSVAGL